MLLRGSCQCQKITYEVDTDWYYPLMWCYCHICRKTNGGPISCNLKGEKKNLKLTKGEEFLRMYCAEYCQRYFCSICSSPLYILDDRWPDYCWPNAASIDTPLPSCPEQVHIYVKDVPNWFLMKVPGPLFDEYPELAIEDWHREMKLET